MPRITWVLGVAAEAVRDGLLEHRHALMARDVSLSLLVRTYHGQAFLWKPWAAAAEAFWPYTRWPVVLVLDDESQADHDWAAELPSWVRVAYHGPPAAGRVTRWRRTTAKNKHNVGTGYCRMLWSQFYSDLFAETDFVAITDLDALFHVPIDVDLVLAQRGVQMLPRIKATVADEQPTSARTQQTCLL